MIAILLAGLSLPFFHPPQVQVHRYGLEGWVIETRFDRFTHQTTCKLTRRGLTVQDGRVAFRFGDKADTSQAYYRLDDSPAVPVRGEVDTAHAFAIDLDRAPLANPSYGEVVLPLARLRTVQRVAIRLDDRRQPVVFKLNGLGGALRSAAGLGCGDL